MLQKLLIYTSSPHLLTHPPDQQVWKHSGAFIRCLKTNKKKKTYKKRLKDCFSQTLFLLRLIVHSCARFILSKMFNYAPVKAERRQAPKE